MGRQNRTSLKKNPTHNSITIIANSWHDTDRPSPNDAPSRDYRQQKELDAEGIFFSIRPDGQ